MLFIYKHVNNTWYLFIKISFLFTLGIPMICDKCAIIRLINSKNYLYCIQQKTIFLYQLKGTMMLFSITRYKGLYTKNL